MRPKKSLSEVTKTKLKKKGLFSLKEALALGLSQPMVSRMVSDGRLERLARNVYRLPEAEIEGEEEDFDRATRQLGRTALISGLSALHYYKLLDRAPQQVWVLVPPGKRTKDPRLLLIRTKENLKIGVDDRPGFRIATLERALVDAFRYATKMGPQIAVRATRQALRDRRTSLTKVLKLAHEMHLEKYVLRYWEAIESEHE